MQKDKFITSIAFLMLILSSCSGGGNKTSDSSSDSDITTSIDTVYTKLSKEEFDNAFSDDTISNLRIKGTQYQKYLTYQGGVCEGTTSIDIEISKNAMYLKNVYQGVEKVDKNAGYYYLFDLRTKYPHTYDADTGTVIFNETYSQNYYFSSNDENTHDEYYVENGGYVKTTSLNNLDEIKQMYGFISLPMCGINYEDVNFDDKTGVYSLNKESLSKALGQQYYIEIKDGYFTFTCGNDKRVNYFHYYLTDGETIYEDELYVSDYDNVYVSLPENYSECNHLGYDVYDYYDNQYHYTYCSNCHSIISASKHTYDGNSCSVCGFTPATYQALEFGDSICQGHVEAGYSTVTNNCIEVTISDMDSQTINIKDDNGNVIGLCTTYKCSNEEACNLVIIADVYNNKIDDCHTEVSATYEFYKEVDGNLVSLRDDIIVNETNTNHNYVAEPETTIDACHGVINYTCSNCGDSYSETVTHHTGYTVKAEYGKNITTVCETCGERIYGLTGYIHSDNEYVHQYYYYGYVNGSYQFDSASGLIHTPSIDDPNVCAFCGQEDIMHPIEESADSSTGYYGYHLFYKPSDEGENYVSELERYNMSPLDDETGDYMVLVCSGSDKCGLKIEYKNISQVLIETCVSKSITEFRIYKNDVLIKTLNLVRYYYYHEFSDENKVVTYDSSKCATITQTKCSYCDYVKEEISYNHTEDYWSEVDGQTGLHTMYHGCTQCGANSEYYMSFYGHWYQEIQHKDSTYHDINVSGCACTCGNTIYDGNPIGGFTHEDLNQSTILDNELATVKVTSCVDCSDFVSLDVNSSTEATTENDVTTYASGDNTLTIKYEKPGPVSCNGIDCVKVTLETITITYNNIVIYTNTYITDLTVSHTDNCKKHVIFEDGFATVYQYDCGLYECDC